MPIGWGNGLYKITRVLKALQYCKVKVYQVKLIHTSHLLSLLTRTEQQLTSIRTPIITQSLTHIHDLLQQRFIKQHLNFRITTNSILKSIIHKYKLFFLKERPCPSWYLENRKKCIAHHKHNSVTYKPTEQINVICTTVK